RRGGAKQGISVHLVVVGLNHRTAPVELREKLAFPEATLPGALRALQTRPGFRESAIVSTCNRTEVYASFPHTADDRAVLQFLTEDPPIQVADLESHVYTHRDAEAVRHLFRVASGLDSLVLGEPQILGQVRDAFTQAAEAGSLSGLLNGLFRAAIATG